MGSKTSLCLVALVLPALLHACSGRGYTPQPGGAPLPPLLGAAELKARIASGPRPILVDTRPGSRFDEEHVAGSASLPIDGLLPVPEAELDDAFRERAIRMIERSGARSGFEIVAIDRGTLDGFERASAYCWLVSLAGMERCRVLAGGIGAWKAAGGDVARGPAPLPRAEGQDPPRIPARPDSLATLEQLRRVTANGDAALVDVGASSTVMPGAMRVAIGTIVSGGGVVDPAKLEDAARAAGLRAESEAIVLGDRTLDGAAGWFLVSRALGLPLVRLFPGGLAAWHPVAAPPAPPSAEPAAGAAAPTAPASSKEPAKPARHKRR